MKTDHDNNSDGSDTFWPGYVDAVTNLVLNLLFLLTVMIVAVFMFALELGRSSPIKSDAERDPAAKKNSVVAKAAIDPVKENVELKIEIERLKLELSQRVPTEQPGRKTTIIDAAYELPKPPKGLDTTMAGDSEVTVRFIDNAVTFTDEERDRLLITLKPIAAGDETTVFVEVPPGFSEAKRMGFYRAMAVRNLLLELTMPKEKIDVLVVEGGSNANASLVRVGKR